MVEVVIIILAFAFTFSFAFDAAFYVFGSRLCFGDFERFYNVSSGDFRTACQSRKLAFLCSTNSLVL
jgi:hypothetical protein